MNRAVLIYDGECPLCQCSVRLLKSRSRPGELEFLPFQAPQRTVRYPDLSEEACRQAMQLVLPEGPVLAGSEALPETLRRLEGMALARPSVQLAWRRVIGPASVQVDRQAPVCAIPRGN